MSDHVDVVVIGMGPGGEDVAGRLADAGLDVVGIERGLVGGECPYWACVPSKMAVRAGNLLAEARRAPELAGRVSVEPDWTLVARRIREDATDDWDDRVAVERFTGRGGRLVRGEGRISGPGTVVVGDREIRARRAIVVATGTRPAIPPVPGLAGSGYWTNRDAVAAKERPGSLVVLGGGAVGVELGQVFARFGVRTTIVEAGERLLAAEEPEAGDLVGNVLRGEGVDVRVGAPAERVVRDRDGVRVTLAGGDVVSGERLLVATGRTVDPGAAGLDTVGVPADAHAVPVDEHLRVAPGIWAVGDVTGNGAFTHVAMYQARIAAADILGEPHEPAAYHALPRVTFTDPEIGAVGLTEAQAREAGVEVAVGAASVPSSARGWIHQEGNEGLVKLVVDRRRDVLVGATAAGPSGGEVLGLLALAVHARIAVSTMREMIYAYPTFHRAVEDALRDIG